MKRIIEQLFILCVLLAQQAVIAQPSQADTSLSLREVSITAPRFSFEQPGLSTTRFDSLQKLNYIHKNVADLLSDQSPLFIKSYGLGSLATTAFRGGSANHTAILWNGISLSSPMNGQIDLSLIPLAAADELFIQHGAGSSLFGSGAIAGVIHLSARPQLNRGITTEAQTSFGSFSDFRQNLSFEISQKRWVSNFQFFNATAENDFPYLNEYLNSSNRIRQTHANLQNRGIINQNRWLIGKHNTLSLNAWIQTTNRNLPPTLLQNQSLSSQSDDALRLHAEWNHSKRNLSTFVRAAWLHETLLFSDAQSNMQTASRTSQLITEAETKITFTNSHLLNVGLHNTFATATNESFERNPQQNRTALFSSYQYKSKNNRLSTLISGRTELVDSELLPFTFSFGADYFIKSWLAVKGNFSKVYRIPTLNDLYWIPGGNPELLPESGYAQELGLNFHHQKNKIKISSQATYFNRNINNWIIWLPNTGFWSPQNIMQVWSRGIETNNTLSYTIRKFKIATSLSTNYVLSENQRSKSQNDASIGRQLIYTPMYSGMFKTSLSYQNFSLTYVHNYVGYRYTSTDNTHYLAPYDLGIIQSSYRFKIFNSSARLFFELNNVWNESYQIMSNRPMPGINFNTGISIKFNQPTEGKIK